MSRIARRIAAFATSRTPAAASWSPSPSARATGSSAARARAPSTRIASPRSASARSVPATACASVTVGAVPLAVARGPGRAPALSGPTRSAAPSASGQRAPARADRLDADRGQPHGVPAQPALGQVSARPSAIRQTSVVVPPMSKAMAFRRPTAREEPRRRTRRLARTRPSRGRRATAADIMPPLDWSRWSVA